MWISKEKFEELESRILEIGDRESRLFEIIMIISNILDGIAYRQNAAHVIEITQDGEQKMGQINGTPVGGASTFTAAFLQASGAAGTLQAGSIPQWTSADANVTITQSADGTQASVALAAAETAASYPLTITAVNSDGATITNTFSIPVLPAVVVPPPPPPDTAATSITLTQNS